MPRPAIHPGEILADELAELGLSTNELARVLNLQRSYELRLAER